MTATINSGTKMSRGSFYTNKQYSVSYVRSS